MDFSGLRLFRAVWLCLIILAAAPMSAWAQPADFRDLLGGKNPLKGPTPKAQFIAKLSADTVAPGDEVTLSITAKLPSKHYIYGTEGVVTTTITLNVEGADLVEDQFVPDREGKTSFDSDFNGNVTKFYDAVTWTRKLRVQPNVTSLRVQGKLEGQYCSEAAEGGQCIRILPAYQFDLAAQASSAPSASPVAAKPSFNTTLRPMRNMLGTATPDPIEFAFRLDPTQAAEGDVVTLYVNAKLNPGWHTYSLTQSTPGGTATEIQTLSLHHLEPLGAGFEADRPYVLEESDTAKLEVHAGEVTWSRKFKVLSSTPGDYGVAGEVYYQVCDETQCKPLQTAEFVLGFVPVADPGDGADAVVSPFAQAIEDDPVNDTATGEAVGRKAAAETRAALDGLAVGNTSSRLQDRGLIPFLILCIGGGFLALLTPCSFPMVPITVSFFLKQSELNHKRPWLLAAVYCGSIVAAFTILGVGISAIFGATKLTELANNPWLNLIIGGVFVAFGLNMLGAFEIRVPTSLLTWSAMHEGGGSYLGAIFMALTFTLTSFTCTFAVAGTLLVSAAQGDVYWPVIGMLAFGAAFASPFFILALVPGLLKKLPKSGGWMNSVKVVMGLVELGAAVKFFSIADLTWNPTPMIFDYTTAMLVWMVLAGAIGAYLMGWYRFGHDTPLDGLSTTRAILALSFFWLTGLLGFLTLQPDRAEGLVMDQVVAFAPPRLHAADADIGPSLEHHGILFALDLDKARPVAMQKQRPLLLDFTGVNCINCRRMEKKMQLPENKERMGQFVNVQLYADKVPAITDPRLAESILKRNLDLQVNWFGDVSLPSYAVVTPDGKQILAAYIGYEQKEGEFTRFLDYGWKRWENLQVNRAGNRVLGVASAE